MLNTIKLVNIAPFIIIVRIRVFIIEEERLPKLSIVELDLLFLLYTRVLFFISQSLLENRNDMDRCQCVTDHLAFERNIIKCWRKCDLAKAMRLNKLTGKPKELATI